MSSDALKLTPEEEQQAKEYEKWLEEHPFTKKWLDTCPGDVGRPSPIYERPKYAETINGAEKIEMENMPRVNKFTKKEVKINNKDGRAGAYYANGDDRFDDDMERIEQDKMNLEAGWYCDHKDEDPRDQILRSNNPNPEREAVENRIKENERSILKAYAEDRKREEIKQEMERGLLSEREEQEIKDILHINKKEEYVAPECKIVEEGVIPGDFDGICRDLMALHARKNKDYGNAAHESFKEFGLISYVIRLNDKMKRLKSLTKPGVEQEVKSESIEDTLMDLAAYAIMAIESMRTNE